MKSQGFITHLYCSRGWVFKTFLFLKCKCNASHLFIKHYKKCIKNANCNQVSVVKRWHCILRKAFAEHIWSDTQFWFSSNTRRFKNEVILVDDKSNSKSHFKSGKQFDINAKEKYSHTEHTGLKIQFHPISRFWEKHSLNIWYL